MYCSECGKVISDKSKFCRYCGAVIEPEETAPVNNAKAAPVSAPKSNPVTSNPKPVTPSASKQEKKKEKLTFSEVIWLAVFVVVFVIICYSCDGCNMASCLLSDTDKSSSSESQLPTAESNTAEYNALFEGTGVYHYTFAMGLDTETENYAMKDANGNIWCADYMHKDGVVQKYCETGYCFIDGASDEEVAALENTFRQEFAEYEALDFVTVTYKTTDIYLKAEITYNNLNQKENIKALQNTGAFVGDKDADVLSMAQCEKLLINEGFIKK